MDSLRTTFELRKKTNLVILAIFKSREFYTPVSFSDTPSGSVGHWHEKKNHTVQAWAGLHPLPSTSQKLEGTQAPRGALPFRVPLSSSTMQQMAFVNTRGAPLITRRWDGHRPIASTRPRATWRGTWMGREPRAKSYMSLSAFRELCRDVSAGEP